MSIPTEKECHPGESWQRLGASESVDVLQGADLYIEVIDREGYILRMPPATFFVDFALVSVT